MHIRRIIAAGVTSAAVVLGGSLSFPGLASADPTTPQTYTAVGSNTTQDAIAALAGQAITPSGSQAPPAGVLSGVGSYEATPVPPPPQTITPKCGVTFTRPNGSGAGIAALSASINPDGNDTFDGSTITGCVQFARSSSGPNPSAGPGADPLTYIPFARDAVGYIYVGDSSLGSLTQTQLSQIYQGEQPISGVTVTPYLPQAGSGTRNFWLQVLGNPTLGPDVNQDSTNEENTASVIGSLPAGTNAIYPFSISSYVAQSNGFSADTGISTVTLGNPAVDDDSNFIDPVTPGGFGQIAPNPSFYSTVYGRDVYNVVPTTAVTDFINGTADDYTDLLDQIASTTPVPAGATSPAIASPAALTIIHDFGFLSGVGDGYAYDDEVGVPTAPTGPYSFTP